MFILKSTDQEGGIMEWVAIKTLDKSFVNSQGNLRSRVTNFKKNRSDSKFKFNPELIVKKVSHGYVLQQSMSPSSLDTSNSMITNWVIFKLPEVKYLAQQNLIQIPKRYNDCLDNVTISQSVNVDHIVVSADFYQFYQQQQIQQSKEIVVNPQQTTDQTKIDDTIASIRSTLPTVPNPVMSTAEQDYRSLLSTMFVEPIIEDGWKEPFIEESEQQQIIPSNYEPTENFLFTADQAPPLDFSLPNSYHLHQTTTLSSETGDLPEIKKLKYTKDVGTQTKKNIELVN